MKSLFALILFFALISQPLRADDPKPPMTQVSEAIRKITDERAFTNDDAAQVAQQLFTLLTGPHKGRPFADVTEPDAKHLEVNVGYDGGVVAFSYHIRFFREPVMKQRVYVESITLATHNI